MSIFTLPAARVADSNFRVGSGYKLYFYEAGTSNLKDVYSDNTYATPLSNPVVADANGYFVDIWTTGEYKVTLTDADDVVISPYPIDNYSNDTDSTKFAEGVLSAAGSAANVITANLPTTPGALIDQLQVVVEIQHGANTVGNPTFNLNSLGAKTIVRENNKPLQPGDTGGSGAKIYLSYSAANDVWVLLNPAKQGWYPLMMVDGLTVTNNSTDSSHDLDIATGSIADSTQAYVMTLGSALTKRIDATFAVGDDAGGLSDQDNSGAVQANTFYGVFLISKASDPTDCDVIMATTQAKALSDTVAVAAGFDIARLISVVRTESGSDIINWADGGNGWHLWEAAQRSITTSGASTSGEQVTTTVPPFMIGRFSYLITIVAGGTSSSGHGLLTATTQINATPSDANFSTHARCLASGSGASSVASSDACVQEIKVDSGSGIRHRETSEVSSVDINTIGWQMDYTVTDLV